MHVVANLNAHASLQLNFKARAVRRAGRTCRQVSGRQKMAADPELPSQDRHLIEGMDGKRAALWALGNKK